MRRIGLTTLLLTFGAAAGADAQTRPLIVVDPGHGGDVAGVETAGVQEKNIVLRAGYVLAEELVIRGYDVRMTRTGDEQIPNADRRALAEQAGAAALISMHFNANEDPNVHGIVIYANTDVPGTAQAARAVASALERTGGPVTIETRGGAFLSSPTVPTMMVEAGYLTHPVERRLILSRDHHRALAAMIADGLDAFLAARR